MTIDAREHEGLLKYLLAEYCIFLVDLKFVPSVSDWCRGEGIEEPDRDRPLRLVVEEEGERGCKLVVRQEISKQAMQGRLNALDVRSSLQNTATDRAGMLESDKKKLAYLFLSEYASLMPDNEGDELLMDNWAFQEMERLDFFKE